MDLVKQDATAIDMVIVALRKGHFFNIEGDEVLALSSHVQRLAHLKGRILKELEVRDAAAQIQFRSMKVSEARPVKGLEDEKKN